MFPRMLRYVASQINVTHLRRILSSVASRRVPYSRTIDPKACLNHSVSLLTRRKSWTTQPISFARYGWFESADRIPYRDRRTWTTTHGGRAREAARTIPTIRTSFATKNIFAITKVKRIQETCQIPSPKFLLRIRVSCHPDHILDIHSVQESIPKRAHDSTRYSVSSS